MLQPRVVAVIVKFFYENSFFHSFKFYSSHRKLVAGVLCFVCAVNWNLFMQMLVAFWVPSDDVSTLRKFSRIYFVNLAAFFNVGPLTCCVLRLMLEMPESLRSRRIWSSLHEPF